ncbi:MAG: hypothetical protein CSA34_02060 [Desulfobulbus propionicus]|nr:MAG: hypothetical protein CSA34_02060 [Desulfobulbus propionicus]
MRHKYDKRGSVATSKMTPATTAPVRKGILYHVWNTLPRLLLLVFIVVLVKLMFLIGAKKEEMTTARAAAKVREKMRINAVLLQVQPGVVNDILDLPGTIEPWTRLQLKTKVHGAIAEVLVQEGDNVLAGQVLARLEKDDYTIALDAADAAYQLAQATYARDQVMFRKKIISSANLDVSKTSLSTARSALEQARLQLSRCEIKAPVSGVISRVDAEIGLLMSVGDPVLEILQIDRVKAVVGIPESDVAAVRQLAQAKITVTALGDAVFTGRRHFLAPAPENSAYLYRLELAVENPEHRLLPGMFFRSRIIKRQVKNALAIPLYAIVARGDKQYVFVANDQTVERRAVKIGIIEGWLVEITQGLDPGDRVLVEGQREVEAGQEINIIKVLTDPHERLL